MTQTTLTHSSDEIAEIERHKYFLSEKAGYDVGWAAAEQDWEANHAEDFRRANSKSQSGGGIGRILGRLLAK